MCLISPVREHLSSSLLFVSTKLSTTAVDASRDLKIYKSPCLNPGAEITVKVVATARPSFVLTRILDLPSELCNLDESHGLVGEVDMNVPCIAKNSWSEWVRVKLLKNLCGTYQVYAVDYGYVFEVRWENIKPLSIKYSNIPAQCFLCQLALCDQHIERKQLNVLKQCVVKLKVEEWNKDSLATVFIYVKIDDTFKSINQVLSQGGTLEPILDPESDYAKFYFDLGHYPSDNFEDGLSDTSF